MCKHLNCKVTEVHLEEMIFVVSNGVLDRDGVVEPIDVQNRVLFECEDCGLEKYYSRKSKHNPQWVKDILDQF